MTPKQRMLNAYRGAWSDRYPVAPEFWSYYPARILGVDMIQYGRDIPLWKGVLEAFRKHGTDGWCSVRPSCVNPDSTETSSMGKVSDTRFRETVTTRFRGTAFTTIRMYDVHQPPWTVEYPVKSEADLGEYFSMAFSPDIVCDLSKAVSAYKEVGDEYLLELGLGTPFFDQVAHAMGFERAIFYFTSENPSVLESYRARFTEYTLELVRKACARTTFESLVIGCSYSCNSLIGPAMWRKWDKPHIKAVSDEVHRHGRLLHVHFHGKCMETLRDLAETGVDCVCPFERPPGGDIDGIEGLRAVRESIGGRVTVNGNVHTVETLIRGTPEKVREEVRQIREAFRGEPRLIIGTGDQVGRETPVENIDAMVEEAQKPL